MSFTYFVAVAGAHHNGQELLVHDLDNRRQPIVITGRALMERAGSADQVHEEQKVTKTRAAELLVSAAQKPITVAFVKQDGTERTLRGRLIHPEPLLGRSMVEDLDHDGPHRTRLVDHRTIQWLIRDGIKYIVKS